jgi:hypothetical protein
MTEHTWRGDALFHGGGKTGFSVVPDQQHPRMWRVRYPDGKLSDLVNRTRARDAASVAYETQGRQRRRGASTDDIRAA